ncbi:hypothetical protein OLX02_14720 [Novosphingobium sp. KCTC 2891]|uniref:DUF6691 family protein n=1 Tax=Novosphingobium sp. KCTC 2891 TaxID=2989730 RepID=UPI0022218993|nr:DUF6691 family protein [Novosphingobium sp. KCTC 2891]MCW1384074.1 hypothetical protein [Novosphingobium sp. KCTC 2891]
MAAVKALSVFVAGLVFGAGLLLSGMANPDKVLGFFVIGPRWDPSLAFVMGGALLAAFPLYRIAHRRDRSLTGEPLAQPDETGINARLAIGAALFGAGWGLAGICPGPAVVALPFAPVQVGVFLVSMLLGWAVVRRRPRS